jgi:hypothetical protein
LAIGAWLRESGAGCSLCYRRAKSADEVFGAAQIP